jgi:tetratricopeptide (TPR) repeat protein
MMRDLRFWQSVRTLQAFTAVAAILLIALSANCAVLAIVQEVRSDSSERSTSPVADETDDEARERRSHDRFLSVLEQQPRPGTALDRVYRYHADRGSLNSFLESLQSKVLQSPGNSAPLMLLGLIQQKRGHFVEAAAAFTRAEPLRPDDPLVSLLLGRCLFSSGQSEAAAEAFERAISRKPSRAELLRTYLELSKAYRRSQQPERAAAIWPRLESEFPDDLRVREQIAAALLSEGDLDGALRHYQELSKVSQNPEQSTQAAFAAGTIQSRLGRHADAIKTFESQLENLAPGSWLFRQARRRIDSTLLNSGNPSDAIQYYESWLERHPDDLDAIERLGQHLASAGRTADAERWILRALKVAPSDMRLRLAYIELLKNNGRLLDAIQQHEQLQSFDPNNPDRIEQWGALHLRRRDVESAQRKALAAEVWQRMLQGREQDAAIHSRVAGLLANAGLVDQALANYRTAMQLAPAEAQYCESLGQYLYSLGRIDEALEVWNQIPALLSDSAEGFIQLAEILDRFGSRDRAITAMKSAVERSPDFTNRLRYVRILRESFGAESDQYVDSALEQLSLADSQAETSNDKQLLLNEKIETLTMAGRLSTETERLATLLSADANASVDQWVMLARYLDADQRLGEAIQAVQTALQRDTNSVHAWTVAAELFEKSGRFTDAIAALEQLLLLDSRIASDGLKRLAMLQHQLGQHSQALKTVEQLMGLAPENAEYALFSANLCLQQDRRDDAIRILRRAIRINSSDRSLLQTLAPLLVEANEFAEATDLHWQALESETDVEEQRRLIEQLAPWYLRLNRFDQLVQRLEERSRETSQHRASQFCLATAYGVAGDHNAARRSLELLLDSDDRDPELLSELSIAAESEGDLSRAAEYQRQSNSVLPTEDGRMRLAGLLIELGDVDEAEALLTNSQAQQSNAYRILKVIDDLIDSGRLDTARSLCERILQREPAVWETRTRLGAIYWRLGKRENAVQQFDELLKLRLNLRTAASATLKSERSDNSTVLLTPFKDSVPNWLNSLTLEHVRCILGDPVDERAWYRRTYSLGVTLTIPGLTTSNSHSSPFIALKDFGCARLVALGAKRLYAIEQQQETLLLEEAARLASADRWNRWDHFFLSQLAAEGPGLDSISAAETLAQENDPEARVAYLLLCFGRINLMLEEQKRYPLAASGVTVADARMQGSEGAGQALRRVPESLSLSSSQCELLLSCYDELLHSTPDWGDALRPELLPMACSQSGSESLLRPFIEKWKRSDAAFAELTTALALSLIQQLIKTSEALELLNRMLAASPARILETQAVASVPDQLWMPLLQQMFDQAASAKQTEDCLQVFDWWLGRKVDESLNVRASPEDIRRRRPLASSLTAIANGDGPQAIVPVFQEFTFPCLPSRFSTADLQFLATVFDAFRSTGSLPKLTGQVALHNTNTAGNNIDVCELVMASFAWWDHRSTDSAVHLRRAVELSPHDAALRWELAEMYESLQDPHTAITLLDQLSDSDPEFLRVRELKILDLAAAVSDSDRGRQAAERLAGLQLDPNAEAKLINNLRRLELDELVEQVKARSKSTSTQVSLSPVELLDQYEHQNNEKAAVALSQRIVRRLTPPLTITGPTRFSRTKQAADLRRRAFEILKRSGELEHMIEQQKEQLNKAPASRILLEVLIEYLEANGNVREATEVRERLYQLRTKN